MVAHSLVGLDKKFDVHMGMWPIKKWLFSQPSLNWLHSSALLLQGCIISCLMVTSMNLPDTEN